MSWVLFTLLAVNLWCISNIIDKHVISKRLKNPATPMIICGVGSLVYSTVLFLFFKAAFSLPLVGLGLLYTLALLLYYKALKIEEASQVIALYSMTPIFVAILAFILLGESFGIWKYIGIILIVIGAIIISIGKGSGLKTKILPLMLLITILYASYNIALKHFTGDFGFLSVFAGTQFGLFLGALILLARQRKVEKFSRRTAGLVLLSQVAGVLGLMSFIYAVSIGPVSLVSALENTQPLFLLVYVTLITMFHSHIIKEDISRRPLFVKALAIIIMALGAYLVSI